MDNQNKFELYIRMRSQELYQEWSNDPNSILRDIIAQGMMDVARFIAQRPVIGLELQADDYMVKEEFAKEGLDGILEYADGPLTIDGQVAKDIMGLASAFVMSEEDLLKHLISLGKLVASTTLYLKKKNGEFVALEEVK